MSTARTDAVRRGEGGTRPLPAPVIDVRTLTKRFGELVAVDELSFSLDAGTVTGFLGPNGVSRKSSSSSPHSPRGMASARTPRLLPGALGAGVRCFRVGGVSDCLCAPVARGQCAPHHSLVQPPQGGTRLRRRQFVFGRLWARADAN